ncbi:MAG: hypothetical protein WD065_07645 [Planctomycetaceae bacterium]
MEYDIFGRQVLAISFEGKITRFVYDEGTELEKGTGRLLRKEFFDNLTAYDNGNGTPAEEIVYSYDAFGRLAAVADPRGETTYEYDPRGQLIRTASPEGAINYEYDSLGRKTRMTTGDEADPVNDFTYEYDALGRLAKVTVVERSDVPLATPEETAYAYDLQGNLDLQTNPNGVITDYDYDALNRLTDLVHYLPDETPETLADNDKLAQFEYEVRADGRREQATEKFWFDNDVHENNITWTYDDAGRLIDEVFDHYDDDFDQTQHFTYDLVGNRLLRVVDQGNDSSIDQVFASAYDANDRLLTETADTDGTAGVDQTTTYGYTGTQQASKAVLEGSITTSEITYEYDLRGQLQKVTSTANSSTSVSEYEYDHNGVRVKQTVSVNAGTPVVTTYLIDAHNFTGYAKPIAEFVDGVLSRVYTFGHQVLSQADSSGNAHHLLMDGSGSTRLLINATLSILEAYHFDAFGIAIGFDPATALTTWLRSQDSQHDQSTGLEYHLARWRQGHRFLTLDPFFGNLNNPQSLHKRLYVHGDPINGIDPTGWEFSLGGSLTSNSIGGSLQGISGNAVMRAAISGFSRLWSSWAGQLLRVFAASELAMRLHTAHNQQIMPIPLGKLQEDIQFAMLAKAVYNSSRGGAEADAGAGWSVEDTNIIGSTGFKARVFVRGGTRIVAFAGTDDGPDIITDVAQGFGFQTEQYDEAIRYAQFVEANFGPIDRFVGHSLGGGLAALSAMVFSKPATTFNAAGVNPLSLSRHGGNIGNAAGLIDAYRVQGEILSTAQDTPGPYALLFGPAGFLMAATAVVTPGSNGTNYWLPARVLDLARRHGIDEVLYGMKAMMNS